MHKSRRSRGSHVRWNYHPWVRVGAGESPVVGAPHVWRSPWSKVGRPGKSRGHTHGTVSLMGVGRGVIGAQPRTVMEFLTWGVLVAGAVCQREREDRKEGGKETLSSIR